MNKLSSLKTQYRVVFCDCQNVQVYGSLKRAKGECLTFT